jgi:hypothetical protein
MREAIKGIHRRVGTGGEPNSAWVGDGMTGARISEEEYRAGGYLPEFDSLPVLIVQRVPVTWRDDELCNDDREFIEEMMKKNANRT